MDKVFKKIQKFYQINQNYIYLNNAGTTPINNPAKNELNQYFEEYANHGILNKKFNYFVIKDSIQTILAELLNCEKKEIAIIHNTAEGMNLISHGLDLKPEDEILLLENEYPSNVYPWQHWQAKGIHIHFVPICDTPADFLRALSVKISHKTKVLALSAVHWCTGMPLPLAEIAELCRQNDVLLVVDGAQGVGHIKIDMKNWGLNLMAFSAWKWLLGPLGLGILIVRKEIISRIKHVFKGTLSVENAHSYLPYTDNIIENAERYIYSTPNFSDWIYFNASLKMLQEIGFDNVKKRIFALSDYLYQGLKDLDFEITRTRYPEIKTGILCAKKNGMDSDKLVNDLRRENIITAHRLDHIRLSPHIYISEEQLDRVLIKIKKRLSCLS